MGFLMLDLCDLCTMGALFVVVGGGLWFWVGLLLPGVRLAGFVFGMWVGYLSVLWCGFVVVLILLVVFARLKLLVGY